MSNKLMKSYYYIQHMCERCEKLDMLRRSPGDVRSLCPIWIDKWIKYMVATNEIVIDPEGRCAGCTCVRINLHRVLAETLWKLGVKPTIKFHV